MGEVGFSWWLSGKEATCLCRRCGFLSLDWEDPPGEGNGNTLQYSFLGNPMNRGAWQAAVHRVTRVRHDLTTKRTTTISQSSVFPSIENQNLLFFHEFGLFIN